MIQLNYHCTQQELYAVCALGWESCSQNLDKFSSLKSKYSPAFVQARKTEIETVAQMPNVFRRQASLEMLKHNLKKQAMLCIEAWKRLQSHIREAWPAEPEQNSALKSAGQAHYQNAYKMKWESNKSLLTEAEIFIRENSVRLMANENMPAAFPETFTALSKTFNEEYARYQAGFRQADLDMNNKLDANAKLHKDLMSMFRDAKMLFKSQPTMMKYFTFDAVLAQVSGPGAAGIKGKVSSTSLPATGIQGLELVLLETGEEAAVEKDGSYRFSQLASGTYTIHASAPGYKEKNIPDILVNTGSYTMLNIELQVLEKA